MASSVKIDLRGLLRFRDPIRRRPRFVNRALQVWVKLYGKFIEKRFKKFSGKGGNWKHLKKSTIRAKGHDRILYRTGLMQKNLTPEIKSITGARSKGKMAMVLSVGRGKSYDGGPTLSRIIKIHNDGEGHMPKRQIYVRPDDKLRANMARIMKAALVATLKQRV